MRERNLISPVPEKYKFYSDQEKIEETECLYKKRSELYPEIEIFEAECRKRLDIILEKQAEVTTLLAVFGKEEIQTLCLHLYEFEILNRFCKIAQIEKQFGEPCVLDNIHGMKEAAEYYQKCIFLIRRFEFDWEEDGELLDFVRQRGMSYIYLSELICVKEIVQKVKAGCRIAEYLYRNGCKRESVLLIMSLEQKIPYSERKVMHFAMTLLDMEERQLAYEVLMKYQNPDEEIKELQSALSKML